MLTTTRVHLLVALSLVALASAASAASEPPAQNRMRGDVTFTGTSNTWDDEAGDPDHEGLGLAWERMITPFMGLELSAFSTRIPMGGVRIAGIRFAEAEHARMTPVSVSALFHFTPRRVVDFYLGPGVSLVTWDGTIGDEVAPMFNAGIDVTPHNSKVGFHFGFRHIFTSEVDGLDPLTLGLGIGARF